MLMMVVVTEGLDISGMRGVAWVLVLPVLIIAILGPMFNEFADKHLRRPLGE